MSDLTDKELERIWFLVQNRIQEIDSDYFDACGRDADEEEKERRELSALLKKLPQPRLMD